jgi:glutamate-5-semialdehyde dehydrogenase
MSDQIVRVVVEKAVRAREASRRLAYLSTDIKDRALKAMAMALVENTSAILEANARDIAAGEARGLSKALLDRLLLNESRVRDMAEGLNVIVNLPDPVGEVLDMVTRPNGLQVGKMRVPLGVIGMIYEARPNVTVDAAGLCLKAGNAVLLRGGSEAINSNATIARIIAEAATGAGVPEGAVEFINLTDRAAVNAMLKLNDYLDVVIPRGGKALKQAVIQNATVPVVETGMGNCHVFIDRDADLEMAARIVVNAKCQRPGVCNAAETLLVDAPVAEKLLPELLAQLKEQGVEIRGCPQTREMAAGVVPATEEDWDTEYLDMVIAVRVVDDFGQAVDHIYRWGTKHSEAIVTESYTRARRFLREVDAAAVYVNASTRFTDGGVFGFGAELGISTQKLHARGPMGLKDLTSTKYIIFGDGHVR